MDGVVATQSIKKCPPTVLTMQNQNHVEIIALEMLQTQKQIHPNLGDKRCAEPESWGSCGGWRRGWTETLPSLFSGFRGEGGSARQKLPLSDPRSLGT